MIINKENANVINCNKKNCNAVNGIGHSDECEQEHDELCKEEYQEIFPGTIEALDNLIDIKKKKNDIVPNCFDRADYRGRVFDNCRYFQTCKQCKPICIDNPLS